MRKLVSSEAALAADRAAEADFGYPSPMLMEEAGIRLQDTLERLLEQEKLPCGLVVYLVGSRNNGGDGLVMARQAFLLRTLRVAVVSVFPPSSESCVWQDSLARKLEIPVLSWPGEGAASLLREAAVWVDAVWGVGLTGPLREERAAVLRQLETFRAEHCKPCAAVDVPSGLWKGWTEDQAVLKARWTLSAGWLKDFCFYPGTREPVGTPVEVPLAFPKPARSSADLLQETDLSSLLPRVSPGDHKGKRGHVALVGGAAGMTGALILASRSAAAAGAGLVSLGIDAELTALVAPQLTAFQVRPVPEVISRASRYDSLVVGPGWGRGEDRVLLMKQLWETGLPLVIDADGLSAWTAGVFPPRSAPVVLTPHPGEFLRLGGGETASVEAAETLARTKGVTVVLKGAATWILGSDGRRAVWDGSNPAMGTGGSGDCLAGVVGALLARGLRAFEAASAAVVLHGAAGRDLATQLGWFTADRLPEALARRAAACMADLGPL